MTAYWVDYGMSYVNNHAQFRFPLALQCLFALVTIALMLVLPESPRWVSFQDKTMWHFEANNISPNSLLRKNATMMHATSSWPYSRRTNPMKTLSTGRCQRSSTRSMKRERLPMEARTRLCSRMGHKSSSTGQCWELEANSCNNSRV